MMQRQLITATWLVVSRRKKPCFGHNWKGTEMNEPCLCGATDCPRCYPYSWSEDAYDEDDPKHHSWADREEDRRDYEKDHKREMGL